MVSITGRETDRSTAIRPVRNRSYSSHFGRKRASPDSGRVRRGPAVVGSSPTPRSTGCQTPSTLTPHGSRNLRLNRLQTPMTSDSQDFRLSGLPTPQTLDFLLLAPVAR